MNKNYSYPTTMYEIILAQMYVFLVLFTIFAFYPKNNFKQKLETNIFLPEICTFGRNIFIHCSQIIVVYIYIYIFGASF